MKSTNTSRKVDISFEPLYFKLSYRRKFLRTLWMTPFAILLIIYIINISENFLLPTSLSLIYVFQLGYNCFKWKTEKGD